MKLYTENARRKQAFDAEALEAQSMLAEILGGADAEAARARSTEAATARARADRAKAESNNLRDIMVRQRHIRGFYVAPKSSYVSKAAQVKEMEERLRMMGVDEC